MTIKLSIIIPVYNSKKYLKGCLNSICKQVKKNVEVIIVNDCSADGSIKICKNFAKKHNFIRLINLKKNKGVAYCRNKGIRIAVGNYISFVDSDDRLLSGSIDNILNHIKNFYGKEVFVLGYIYNRFFNSKNNKPTNRTISENQIFSLKSNKGNKSIINCIKNFDRFRPNCWFYIVKKKFLYLNNIYFKELKIYEDKPFVSQILCLAKSFKIIEKPTYIYQRFATSTLSNNMGYICVISHIKVIKEIALFMNKKKKFLNKLKIKFLFSLLQHSIKNIFSDIIICNTNEIKKASKYFYKYNSAILKLSNFGFKKLNFSLQKQKVINDNLLKYKNKKINAVNKKFRKSLKNNIILFCGGKDGRIALKILTDMGAKIPIIIDNNNKFSGEKIDNATIKNPSYLKKNLNKLSSHKIIICINDINLANMINLQLNKIGIRNENISYFNY